MGLITGKLKKFYVLKDSSIDAMLGEPIARHVGSISSVAYVAVRAIAYVAVRANAYVAVRANAY